MGTSNQKVKREKYIKKEKEKEKEKLKNIDYIEESGSFDISGKGWSIINMQMNNSVCKIIRKDNKNGTGFLCKIPYPDQFNLLPVLITCYHVLDKVYIDKEKKINLKFNKEKIITFNIDDSKKIYMSNQLEYDITIIEINSNDNLYNKKFIDIDDCLYKDDNLLNETYKKANIYLIHYPNIIKFDLEPKLTFGEIKGIAEDNYNLKHSCLTDVGSSGCPIFNSNNYKIIGIHLGKSKNLSYKKGTVLKIPIFKFYNINNNYNINIIKDDIYIEALIFCLLRIEKFKKGFNESYTFIKSKNATLSSLIFNFMKENNNNNNLNAIIYKVKKTKNEINNEILKNINNEQLIYLNLILKKLHEELNINQFPNLNYLREGPNEIICLNSFMQNYKQNKSIIQDIFFGIKESIINCNICGTIKYSFDFYKLIYFELKKEQQPFNLQNSILIWENNLIQKKYICPRCNKLTDMSIRIKTPHLSDILIIAIINKDKIKIDFKTIMKTPRYEYKLFSFINEVENNVDIIFYLDEKYYIIKNGNNFEVIIK